MTQAARGPQNGTHSASFEHGEQKIVSAQYGASPVVIKHPPGLPMVVVQVGAIPHWLAVAVHPPVS
jgi:hypothetical protein